jgi:hypothetical protein
LVCNGNDGSYIESVLQQDTKENVGTEKEEEKEGRRKVHDPELCIYPLKAYWLRDAPAVLTFKNCTFCPQCFYVFCIM